MSKIALVVHGRFHAFDLARALLQRGHDVTVLTNYPRWAARRFGLPPARVRGFWMHGLATRLMARLATPALWATAEPAIHRAFGRWAATELVKEEWDVVHLWSGVAEEALRALAGRRASCWLMRGSAHIRTQARLLEEETARTGAHLDRPSPWMVAREEREYALADHIVTLSDFAYQSFVTEGVPAEKLCVLPLGAELGAFRPSAETVDSRCARLLAGQPLRLLYVGALSFQKGLWDLAALAELLPEERFRLRLVGPVAAEVEPQLARLAARAELVAKQPQHELPQWYAWGDLFLFPTIQDGYAMVLAQAQASALPILTTPHCAGPEMVRGDAAGWIVPIRRPDALHERLLWCDEHRAELVAIVRRLHQSPHLRDWADVAADFEALALDGLPAAPQTTLS